jgi:hypothetical protein
VKAAMAMTISGNTESVLVEYIPAIYALLMGLLNSGDAEECVNAMGDYNITPVLFKEHIF